jgi:hypothetical protein
MISAYFTRQRFISIEELLETGRFNSSFFVEKIISSLIRSVSLLHPRMQAQGNWREIV